MKPGIKFTKTWLDEDMVDLHVDISDGTSSFATQIYVGHRQLRDAIQACRSSKTGSMAAFSICASVNSAPSTHRALLDAFVHALTAWRERSSEQAELEAIFWN